MTDLLPHLTAATEPNRQLDAEIFLTIGLTEHEKHHCRMWCRMDGRTDLTRDDYIRSWAPPFTASIDAAMTLVPEGWDWSLNSDGSCEIYKDVLPGMVPGAPGSTVLIGEAATRLPALALVIAALRARGVG